MIIKNKNKDIVIKEFIIILSNLDYDHFLLLFYFQSINKIENTFDFRSTFIFNNIDFLENKNIYIGTTGYNTLKLITGT